MIRHPEERTEKIKRDFAGLAKTFEGIGLRNSHDIARESGKPASEHAMPFVHEILDRHMVSGKGIAILEMAMRHRGFEGIETEDLVETQKSLNAFITMEKQRRSEIAEPTTDIIVNAMLGMHATIETEIFKRQHKNRQ